MILSPSHELSFQRRRSRKRKKNRTKTWVSDFSIRKRSAVLIEFLVARYGFRIDGSVEILWPVVIELG